MTLIPVSGQTILYLNHTHTHTHTTLRLLRVVVRSRREVVHTFHSASSLTKDSLDSISRNLSKVIVEQSFFKARESRHRHTAESNNARVLWWSLLVCGIFITVGVVQVVVIRRFFNSGKRKDKLRT